MKLSTICEEIERNIHIKISLEGKNKTSEIHLDKEQLLSYFDLTTPGTNQANNIAKLINDTGLDFEKGYEKLNIFRILTDNDDVFEIRKRVIPPPQDSYELPETKVEASYKQAGKPLVMLDVSDPDNSTDKTFNHVNDATLTNAISNFLKLI